MAEISESTPGSAGSLSNPGSSALQALILAAGEGRRMRPLTLTTPKPLLPLCGRPILDHIVTRLERAGITRLAFNASWLGEQIEGYAARLAAADPRRTIQVSMEMERQETAGAVLQARHLLGPGPILTVNGDQLWDDGPGLVPALDRLRAAFDPARMAALLLLVPLAQAVGHEGSGDFHLSGGAEDAARPILGRRDASGAAPLIFTGVQIMGWDLLAGAEPGPQSFNPFWNQAMAAGRLWGLVHRGPWYHLGTPKALALAEERLGWWKE